MTNGFGSHLYSSQALALVIVVADNLSEILSALRRVEPGSDQPRPSVSEDQGASRDHALTDGVALVKCGADLWISRELVQSLEWDRRHYMNGPGSSTLVITMADGAVHRIKHEPGYLDGTDAYAIERALTNA